MNVVDGELDGTGIDKVRLKIYNKNNGRIYYDNMPGASDVVLPVQAVGSDSYVMIGGTNNNDLTKAAMQEVVPEVIHGLNVRASPNPSQTDFTLNIASSNSKKPIKLQVVDMYGRIVETRNVFADQSITLGDRYRPGTYIVRINQGKDHKELKLIKLSD